MGQGVTSSDGRSALPNPQVRELLAAAARALLAASAQPRACERFAGAHLAALRTAAALLAAEARPARRRGGLRSAWSLLAEVAPDLAEWAGYFQAGAATRSAAEAGLVDAVTDRDADDLVRGVEAFMALVARRVGLPVPVGIAQLVLAG